MATLKGEPEVSELRSALVTGAGQGIGEACAVQLVRDGWHVRFVDLNRDALTRVTEHLSPEQFSISACDLSDPGQIAGLWSEVDDAGQRVTALVNNAGVFPRSSAAETSLGEWNHVLAVNLRAPFLMAQQLVRRLQARGQAGSIVSIGSGQAFRPLGDCAHYSASKAGLVGLTRALASDWGPLRIRVNAVVPGLTDTAQPRAVMDDSDLERAADSIPLRRVGHPEDSARLVAFLLSDVADYITGQTMAVNGGAVML